MFLAFFLALSSFAQEGMWLLTQLDQLDLEKKGLKIKASEIYSPGKPSLYQAVVQLGGGTASFVSPEGLLLTNHHVAYTALQRASQADQNFIRDGFLAADRSAEIQAPGYQALLLKEMKDVTKEVLKAAEGESDPIERDRMLQSRITEITEGIEKGKDDIQAVITPLFNGKQYIQFIYKRFSDIRIVYAPPLSVGNYGGEIDNWMWPRHTGDFSFMRVYVKPDGTGGDYSPDNVPYKSEVWLKVARQPLQENDFTMVIGFPGFTTRYRDYQSAHWNFTYNYPFSVENFNAIIELAEELTKDDPEGQIKVASLTKGLANAMKNYQGKLDGMRKTGFVEKKLDFDKEFAAWLDGNPSAKAKYGDIQAKMKALYEELGTTRERDNVLGLMQGLSGLQSSIAIQAYYTARELEKPENERQPGFTRESVEENLSQLQYAYADYYEPLEKALLVRTLEMASKLPPGQRLEGLDKIIGEKGGGIMKFVDEATLVSKFNNLEFAMSAFRMSSKELEALKDPFIDLAIALYPVIEESGEAANIFSAKVGELRLRYMDALYEWKGTGLYPDANGTMRFTSGPIRGYNPADAVTYHPFTTFKGVMEKNTGKEPFDAPAELTRLYEARDFGRWADPVLNDIPVAFTHQCDITGGSSGSPVMNARGELIGLAFDGNYEAMISDWQYDFDLQRTISVDIRYVMFITEKLGKAGFLLEEMGISE
jgi:hypothetical protein